MAKKYQRTAIRRQQIAEAALTVIAEQGLGHFTTRAIAAQVGITDGTIFRHFKNKQEIVLAAMDRLEAEMFSSPPAEELPPLAQVEQFFRHRAALLGGEASMGRLMFSDQLVHAAGAEGRAKLAGWRTRNMTWLLECLLKVEAEGQLKAPPQTVMMLLQGLLLTFSFERTLSAHARDDLEGQIDRCWQTAATLIFNIEVLT